MKTQILIVMLILFTTSAYSQKMTNFSGIVKDSLTGHVLENVNVFVNERNTGTLTNLTGSFFIFIPEGIYKVSFSNEGYKSEKFTVDLRSDKNYEIELAPLFNSKKRTEGWFKKKSPNSQELIARKL